MPQVSLRTILIGVMGTIYNSMTLNVVLNCPSVSLQGQLAWIDVK